MVHSAGNARSVLDEAVSNFMTAVGEGHHEDVLRAFFRLKIVDIAPLLIEVVATAKKASREVGRSMASVLPEANDAIVVSLQNPEQFRFLILADCAQFCY
jgi:nuclear pore complex protein Nup133